MAQVSLDLIEAAFDKLDATVEVWLAGVAKLRAMGVTHLEFQESGVPPEPVQGQEWAFLPVPEGGACGGFNIDAYVQHLSVFLSAYHQALMSFDQTPQP